MLQTAGGILLAILALSLLPVVFAAARGMLTFGANAVRLIVVVGVGAIPIVAALAFAEHLLPGYGAIGCIWALILVAAIFAVGETLRFRRWKRSLHTLERGNRRMGPVARPRCRRESRILLSGIASLFASVAAAEASLFCPWATVTCQTARCCTFGTWTTAISMVARR